MQKDYKVLPGGYSAGMYVAGQCVEAAIQKLGGKADDRKALAEALHEVSLTDTPRGPVKFDKYGNVVGDVFIRRCERKGGQLINTVIKTYPNVSQFWTYTRRSSWRTRSTRATTRRRRIWRTRLATASSRLAPRARAPASRPGSSRGARLDVRMLG